MTELHC